MKPARLGLIGAGGWGQNYIRTIRSMKGAVLARLASRNPEAPKLAGSGCAVSSEWREVAGAGDLDGVIIATPPSQHAEMTRAALEAGLPVLIEKPLTTSPAEARALLETARSLQGFVMVDHIFLYHPAYRAMKEKARKLGPAARLLSVGGNWGPFRPDVTPLWDYGPHDAALCLDFLGEKPVSVEAAVEREKEPRGEGDLYRLGLKFSGGASAEIRIGNIMTGRHRTFAAFFGDRALVFDDTRARKLAWHSVDARGRILEPGEFLAHPKGLPLDAVLDSFLAAIASKSSDLASLQLGVEVVELLAACEASLPK